jgi:hypothetical protein
MSSLVGDCDVVVVEGVSFATAVSATAAPALAKRLRRFTM